MIGATVVYALLLGTGLGRAEEGGAPGDRPASREIVVAPDARKVGARWCGSRALVLEARERGIEWMSVPDGRRVEVSGNPGDYPLNCSSDGRWVLYADERSRRAGVRVFPVPPDVEIPEWEGDVVDLYRYEVATGRRDRIGVVRAPAHYVDAMAPSAWRVFFGARHGEKTAEMGEPKWEGLWLTKDWSLLFVRWLPDSSGVVGIFRGQVGVEVFGRRGWRKLFNPPLGYVVGIDVDAAGRIYLAVSSGGPGAKLSLHRCGIEQKRLRCERILKQYEDLGSYTVLPAGDVLLTEDRKSPCVRRVRPGGVAGTCIVDRGEYEVVGARASPDGQWALIDRYGLGRLPSGITDITRRQLSVVNLETQ